MKDAIQRKILRKLMNFKPAKWGAFHTEEINLFKGLPSHIKGSKIVLNAIKDLYSKEFLLRAKKTGAWHVSLNPRKAKEIFEFLNLD